jgi:hypothetical protein
MPDAKPRQTLNVDLGELKPLVEAAAQQAGKGTGAWVREHLALAVEESLGEPAPALPRVSPRRGAHGWVMVTTRLSANEALALDAGAAAAGVTKAEYVGRLVLQPPGPSRARAMEVLPDVVARLISLELELRAVRAQLYEAGALAKVDSAVREVRAQAKRAAQALAEVSTTRRQAGRRRQV